MAGGGVSAGADFRKRLTAGELLVGTFVKTPSPILVEVLAETSLDVLCLDGEHAPFDRMSQDLCLAMARGRSMACLVRTPALSAPDMLAALDSGASGVVVPHVDSRERAETLAKLTRFGPGGRGFAGSPRAAAYGGRTMAEHLSRTPEEIAVIAQIEDVDALDHLDAIAEVEGIDALFVGRADLTVALGKVDPKDPAVLEAVESICAAGVKAGRRVGMFVADLSELDHWRARGASFFLLQSDHVFLKAGADLLARTVQRAW